MNRNSLITHILFFIFFLFSALKITAQIEVYKTYSDYQQKLSTKFKNVKHIKGKLVFSDAGEKETSYQTSDIWGFATEDDLVRCDKDGVYIVSGYGKITVYANALYFIYKLNGRKYSCGCLHPEDRPDVFISSGLDKEIYPTHFSYLNTGVLRPYKKRYQQFVELNPEHQKLYDCVSDSYSTEEFRKCVSVYNGTKNVSLKFDNTLIDLGEVEVIYAEREAAPPVKTKFIYTNTTKDTITIKKISNAEGSTWSFSSEPIPPGGKGVINVSINIYERDKNSWAKHASKGKYTVNHVISGDVRYTAITEPTTLEIKLAIVTIVEKGF